MKKMFPSWGAQPTSSAPPRSQQPKTSAPSSSSTRAPLAGRFAGTSTGGKVGPGGNGLGKGGVKRHRKIIRDSIQGITKGDIRRLARRGGIKRISGNIYDEVRLTMSERLRVILRECTAIVEHCDRKTVTVGDVIFVLRRLGSSLYGFDDLKRGR